MLNAFKASLNESLQINFSPNNILVVEIRPALINRTTNGKVFLKLLSHSISVTRMVFVFVVALFNIAESQPRIWLRRTAHVFY